MMMNLKSRIDQLERKAPEAQQVTAVHRVFIDTPEQLQSPERFTKRLIHTDAGRSCTRHYFELERLSHSPRAGRSHLLPYVTMPGAGRP